ncbi:MAG: hypothetical protein KDI31_11035 [Pseudomonadales bacterium]|nr:hypothetical protein [Pseudomonadales bacterium]
MKLLKALSIGATFLAPAAQSQAAEIPDVIRLKNGPIIARYMDGRMGGNVQGPSLIRVPDWVENPLGKYYLYFADHRGTYIRLAYADHLLGPWQTHEAGSLQLEDSFFPTQVEAGAPPGAYAHIASPDVHVRQDLGEIIMYVHGRDAIGPQLTRLATSKDGIAFAGRPEILGRPYFRVVTHGGYYYALAMPGYLYRSKNGIDHFEAGPRFFNDDMRHSALLIRDNTLFVFWTQAGDAPEQIYLSSISLEHDWSTWRESPATELMCPVHEWEGADLPIAPSERGCIDVRANQLRDPAIFEEDGHVYLLYSVAGESGIAIAELKF